MVTNMPTEKSMMTISDLYRSCRNYKKLHAGSLETKTGEKRSPKHDIRFKATSGGMIIWRKKVVENEDDDGDVYRKVTCSARDNNGSGREHTLEMIFYGDGEDMNTKAAVNCSCEWFLYACEVALWHEGSARIEDPIEMRIWSNGEDYTDGGPNPSGLPIICKHIYSALRAGAAKWKARGMSIEEKKKLELKQKKEQEKQKKIEKERTKREEKTKPKKEKSSKPSNERKGIKETKKPPEIKQPKKYATPPPASTWKRKK